MIFNYSITWVILFILLLVGIFFTKKSLHLKFSLRVFTALILGAALGLGLYFFSNETVVNSTRRWFSLIGYGYVDLLKMLIVPLVPASIISGLLKLKDQQELKSLGGRTIGYFLTTATIASILGIVVGVLFHLGVGVSTDQLPPRESNTVVNLFSQFRGFIPASPVKAAADLNMIPLVVFALFIGIAGVIESGKDKDKIEPFRKILESYLTIIIRVTKMVIALTPYGVVGLMAYWMSYTGLAALADLGIFVVAIVVACAIHVFVVYSSFLFFGAKVNPLKFFKAATPAMMLAFTSRSSLGTLTLTVDTMKNRLKVSPGIANFVGPIGAVMNMDACGGIFPAMVSIFAANAFNVDLTVVQYILIVVVSIIASVGSAGVPMGATAFTIVTLTTVGLPVEAIGLVAGVDFLVDMFRTATNVTGDMVVSVLVGNKLGEFDRKSFDEQKLESA